MNEWRALNVYGEYEKRTIHLHLIKRQKEDHILNVQILLMYVGLMMGTVVMIYLFQKWRLRYQIVHPIALGLFFGAFLAVILRYFIKDDYPSIAKMAEDIELKNRSRLQADGASYTTNDTIPDVVLFNYTHYNWTVCELIGTCDFPPQILVYAYESTYSTSSVKKLEEEFEGFARRKLRFNTNIFYNVLFFPIIFHVGFSLKRRIFLRNIGSIFIFGFLGTIISGGIIFAILRNSNHKLIELETYDIIRLGALISATDPVITYSVFSRLNIDLTLKALILGESIVNNAVVTVVLDVLDISKSGTGQYPTMIGIFFSVFGLSVFIGFITACIMAMISKFTRIRDYPKLETSLLLLISYLAYATAYNYDVMSGYVVGFICGLFQRKYAYTNLSPESQFMTQEFIKMANFLCSNFILMYAGLNMFRYFDYELTYDLLQFTLYLLGAIIAGRAVNIYVISFLLNRIRWTRINGNVQHMLFFSGFKGVMAYALSTDNPFRIHGYNKHHPLQFKLNQTEISLMVTIIILVIAVLWAGLTLPLLKCLNISLGNK